MQIEYFSSRRTELGLEYLQRAAGKGHPEASYVYGIILMSRGGESTQHGLKLLSSLKNNSKLRSCRARIKAIIEMMWINNFIVRQMNNHNCCHEKNDSCCINNGRFWNYEEDDDDEEERTVCCDACRWDREVISFSKMLRGAARI